MTSCPEVFSLWTAVRARAKVTRTSTSGPEFDYTLNVRLLQSEIYEILCPLRIRNPRPGADGPGLWQRPLAAGWARRAGGSSAVLPRADRRPAARGRCQSPGASAPARGFG